MASGTKKINPVPVKQLQEKMKGQTVKAAKTTVDLLKKGKRAKMPVNLKPMLATLVDNPFDDPDWVYEVKWDGYRAVAYVDKGKVELQSRNNKSFAEKYYPITAILKKWKFRAILDGEIMVINEKGVSNFGKMQNWRSETDGDLVFYIFDLLWYEGKDLMGLPLVERHELLKQVLPTDDDRIRISEMFKTNGLDFFEAARKSGLEGIMAKKASSTYSPDRRSDEWLKVKANKRQEVVIGGFTKNDGSGKLFSSLLLGVYDGKTFRYVGKVGTGFSDKKQAEMMKEFKPLISRKCPFDETPDVNKPSRFRPNPPNATATWLKPELICEVSFAEVTTDGVFRHPPYEGMRSDKPARAVVLEQEKDTESIVEKKPAQTRTAITSLKASDSKAAKTLLNPNENTQVKKVGGHELSFTNVKKVFWPKEGYTKGDVLNYYYQVSDYILPYLKDRPLSLNRHPNGITGQTFYQKDVKGKSPEWTKTHPYTTSEGEDKEFLVCNDKATLLWMASLGTIEMNPWFSRVKKPDNPDYCVLDLDPDKNTFNQVIEAAQEIKRFLDELEVPCYPKTSGSTGIHIYIPLGAKYTYDQSQMFARLIVQHIHDLIPSYTSIERHIKNRGGKMYLDFLQNRPAATLACPYSLRPKPGATVSMPLHWDEVKKGLKMADYDIKNALQRIKAEGDLFKPVLGKGINMKAALQKLNNLK